MDEILNEVTVFVPDLVVRVTKNLIGAPWTMRVHLKDVGHRRDIVTDFDVLTEEHLRAALHDRFPSIGFVGEEQGSAGQSELHWVVDPIDGTSNFVAGYPHFATSVALVRGSEAIYGCVYDPSLGELFHGARGRGAYLGDTPLRPLRAQPLDELLLAIGLGNDDDRANLMIGLLSRLRKRVQGFRNTGCASLDLAYVAAGRFGCFAHPYLKPWDCNAGVLIVQEAGGRAEEIKELRTPQTRALAVGHSAIVRPVVKAMKSVLAADGECRVPIAGRRGLSSHIGTLEP